MRLAKMLSDRYNRRGNMEDLQAAILKAELAVSTTPVDHPDRAGRLIILAKMLSDRRFKGIYRHWRERACDAGAAA